MEKVEFHRSTNETVVLTENHVVIASVFTLRTNFGTIKNPKFHQFSPRMKFAHKIDDEILYAKTKSEMREILRDWYSI